MVLMLLHRFLWNCGLLCYPGKWEGLHIWKLHSNILLLDQSTFQLVLPKLTCTLISRVSANESRPSSSLNLLEAGVGSLGKGIPHSRSQSKEPQSTCLGLQALFLIHKYWLTDPLTTGIWNKRLLLSVKQSKCRNCSLFNWVLGSLSFMKPMRFCGYSVFYYCRSRTNTLQNNEDLGGKKVFFIYFLSLFHPRISDGTMGHGL